MFSSGASNYAHDLEDYLKLSQEHRDRRESFGKESEQDAEIDRLFLVMEAMWRILKEKHGCRDEELWEKVLEIDLEDGAMDSRKRKEKARSCTHCGRTLLRRKPFCAYCGQIHIPPPFQR